MLDTRVMDWTLFFNHCHFLCFLTTATFSVVPGSQKPPITNGTVLPKVPLPSTPSCFQEAGLELHMRTQVTVSL